MTAAFQVTARLQLNGLSAQLLNPTPVPPSGRSAANERHGYGNTPAQLTPETINQRRETCLGCPDFWTAQEFCMHPACKCPNIQPWRPWQQMPRCPARRWT